MGCEVQQSVKPKGLGVRHAQTFLLFLAMLLAYCMRVNLSMAIVDMTDNSRDTYFDWDPSTKSLILSSFVWGYLVLQIPGGLLANYFGGKVLITTSISVNALVCLLIPLGAEYGGWMFVCGCRVLQGLTQAFVFPTMHHLISQWIPLEEKGRLSTIIYAGSQLGTSMQMIAAGFLASAWGWQSIFYTNGLLGLVWTAAYLYFGAASPEASKLISNEELSFIQTSLSRTCEKKRLATPWWKIITCLPFWVSVIAQCGHNWGFFTFITEMPTYVSKILHADIKKNGMLSSLPYLAKFILSFVMGFMTDLIISRGWLNTTNTRKLLNTIGFWGPALALLGLCYSPEGSLVIPVLMLTLSMGANSAQYCGYMLISIDIAPNFSGVLMGISNFFANIASLAAPLVCGLIINDETDPLDWRNVFFLASGIYFFTNLLFILFATSDRQPWNEPKRLTSVS